MINMGSNTNRWTEEEDKIIIDNYKNMSDRELTILLPGRNKNTIYSRRKKLGLIKPSKKYTYQDVVSEMKKRNYILLSTEDEYQNCTSKMRYICQRHEDKGEQVIDLSHLLQNRGCYYCGRERTIDAKTIDLDKEKDKQIVEDKGLIYIDTYRRDGKIYIKYKCPKHIEFGVQEMYRWYMVNHAVGCHYCHGNAVPKWYLDAKIKEVNPDIELLEPYDNMLQRISCRCKKHNYISTKSVQEILMGRGCKYCGTEKLSEQHFLTDEEVQNRVFGKHPHIKLIKYCGINNKDSEWLCTKHNKIFSKTLSAMLKADETGCDECYKEHMQNLFGYSTEEFTNRLSEVHPELEVVSEYKTFVDPIIIYCTKHNFTFQTTPANILKRISCCPKSFQTYKEETMCTLIESWGYDIERQYAIDGCSDKKALKFDCFLLDFNTAVEYDGENHFYPVKFGTQSLEDAVNKHEYTKRHDEIKNKFCEENNINLIRVPYYEFENMEHYLFEQFLNLNIIEDVRAS